MPGSPIAQRHSVTAIRPSFISHTSPVLHTFTVSCIHCPFPTVMTFQSYTPETGALSTDTPEASNSASTSPMQCKTSPQALLNAHGPGLIKKARLLMPPLPLLRAPSSCPFMFPVIANEAAFLAPYVTAY